MGCECKNLMEAFGDSFQYEDTDFQNISMVLDTYANLLEALRLVSDMMEDVYKRQSIQSLSLFFRKLIERGTEQDFCNLVRQ